MIFNIDFNFLEEFTLAINNNLNVAISFLPMNTRNKQIGNYTTTFEMYSSMFLGKF